LECRVVNARNVGVGLQIDLCDGKSFADLFQFEIRRNPLLLFVNCVLARTHQVQRDIRLISDDPAVVPRSNIENITRFHVDYFAIVHGGSRSPGEDDAHMLHITTLFADGPANMLGPLPTRQVCRTADGHARNMDHLELAFFKVPQLIRLLEPL
jgi:hypothetical protein